MSALADAGAAGWTPPSFRPSVVVLDLDGTCLDARDQTLHPRVRDAVRAVATRMPVIIASGRMYRSALPWARTLGITAPLVCYQGALVREMPPPEATGATLLDEGLAPGIARRTLRLAREHGWHRQAYVGDELYCEEERPEAQEYARIAGVGITFVDDLDPLIGSGSTKIVCVIDDPREAQRCMDVLSNDMRGKARVTWSLPQFIEVVDLDVSKATACELVCHRLGVRLGDAVAIGDAPNDIEMLDAAGYAIAVRSAHDDVLRHADATCAPPDEAGVADALSALQLTG